MCNFCLAAGLLLPGQRYWSTLTVRAILKLYKVRTGDARPDQDQ